MIDLDALVAIDVHTHVQASQDGRGFPEDSPEAAVAKVFGSDALLTVPELAAYYRERRMACVAFMVDSVRWERPVTNEEIAELARGRARRRSSRSRASIRTAAPRASRWRAG